MSSEKLEPKTQDLVASAAEARDRIVRDVERLGVAIFAGAGAVVWRLAVGRHRSR